MYKIRHFGKRLCKGNLSCLEDCDNYSIWRFSPWRRWESLEKFLFPSIACPCRPEWFPVFYWLALCISVLGFCSSCHEFLSVYCGSRTPVESQVRNFKIMPQVLRRNVRLMTTVFIAKMWASLVFGIATVSPSVMSVWLTIFYASYLLELILWICEILFGVVKLDASSVRAHCLPYGTYLLIRCVREVFIRVIDHHGSIDNLKLF